MTSSACLVASAALPAPSLAALGAVPDLNGLGHAFIYAALYVRGYFGREVSRNALKPKALNRRKQRPVRGTSRRVLYIVEGALVPDGLDFSREGLFPTIEPEHLDASNVVRPVRGVSVFIQSLDGGVGNADVKQLAVGVEVPVERDFSFHAKSMPRRLSGCNQKKNTRPSDYFWHRLASINDEAGEAIGAAAIEIAQTITGTERLH